MAISEKVRKCKIIYFTDCFLSLKMICVDFVSSIILSHVITKSSALLFQYLLISQAHVLEFQT